MQNIDPVGSYNTQGMPGMRFRHNGNEVVNVLFCDGHAESFKLGSFPRKFLLVNHK